MNLKVIIKDISNGYVLYVNEAKKLFRTISLFLIKQNLEGNEKFEGEKLKDEK